MSVLVDRLFRVHGALAGEDIPHAFGGAVALAYFTLEPRGTRDLDVNVFVGTDSARQVLKSLPSEVTYTDQDLKAIQEVGQVRLMFDGTPIDLFFNNLPFHDIVAEGTLTVPLEGREIPILDATSLVVFKAMFDRTKDWADIEAVIAWDSKPARLAATRLAELIGNDDPIYLRLAGLIPDG